MKRSLIKSLLILQSSLIISPALAQGFHTANAEVDLGQVLFRHPTTATFSLRNTSQTYLSITNVDTGCGCIKATYPEEPVAPNKNFKVTVTYDANLLGHFQRTILIDDSSNGAPTTLTLKGNVVTEVENFTGDYPYTIGGLLTDVSSIEFDDINRGDVKMQEIHVMNPTSQYVQPVMMHLPNYLKAECIPAKLAPKKAGIIHVTLYSNKLRSLGLNQDNIYLAKNMGENVSEDKEIIVSSILLPPQAALDDQTALNGPRINLSSTTIDMTNFGGKAKKKDLITITNNGRSTLEIRSLQMFTPGLDITLPKRSLAPGESTKMKITGYAEKLQFLRTRPRILMITNDPTKQKLIIEVKK